MPPSFPVRLICQVLSSGSLFSWSRNGTDGSSLGGLYSVPQRGREGQSGSLSWARHEGKGSATHEPRLFPRKSSFGSTESRPTGLGLSHGSTVSPCVRLGW